MIGICGGYQMLGESVEDPLGVETGAGRAEGLKLIAGRTVLSREKTTRVVRGTTPSGHEFEAYEIHMGQTTRPAEALPFAKLERRNGGWRQSCSGVPALTSMERSKIRPFSRNFWARLWPPCPIETACTKNWRIGSRRTWIRNALRNSTCVRNVR